MSHNFEIHKTYKEQTNLSEMFVLFLLQYIKVVKRVVNRIYIEH